MSEPLHRHPDGTAPEPVTGPLDGVRVVELGTVVSGPFGGRLLADMGAEVVKVESPQRLDPLRDWGQAEYEGHRLWWPVHSRNKKLVTLDLRRPEGQALLLDLVRHSDVVLENFRPGTLERWNLGYEQLRAANPGIVLARVSGYGQTGPYRERAGYASVAEAMGGLRYITGYPGAAPPRTGISLGDSLAGMFAVQGILAALYRRDHDPERLGQVVDVSLLESCMALLESAVPDYDRTGYVRQPTGTRLGGIAPSNVYRSSDGTWVVIAANQDTLFRRLCAVLGRPELADDPRYATHEARVRNEDAFDEVVAAWVQERSAADVVDVMNAAGVVCGPVYTVADIVADPHVQARDMVVPHEDETIGTFNGPGITPKFSATPGSVRWSGPWTPGAHNDDVYGRLLGRTTAELETLRGDGVI